MKGKKMGTQNGREEKRQNFVQLRAKGYSYAKIAKQLKVSKGTLANWNAELQEDIATLRAIELESLQEQFYLLKKGRIELLGKQLQKVIGELDKRDFSMVNTERLMELFLKIFSELKQEFIEIHPLSSDEIDFIKSFKYKSGAKMNGHLRVTDELKRILLQLRSGLIDKDQATKEISLLLAILKAKEKEDIENKLEQIEALLKGRK